MEKTIESKIAAECARGNWENFGQLYNEYLPKIYRYCFYRLRHKQAAEDVAGSVFVKAVRNIRSFKPTDAGIGPWLYRIARNSLIDHLRQAEPAVELDEAWGVEAPHNVQEHVAVAIDLELVKSALKDLSPREREVLTLRVWDDLSHREIGEVLGISESASKVAFSRAVSGLKQLMPNP